MLTKGGVEGLLEGRSDLCLDRIGKCLPNRWVRVNIKPSFCIFQQGQSLMYDNNVTKSSGRLAVKPSSLKVFLTTDELLDPCSFAANMLRDSSPMHAETTQRG